MLIQAPTPSSTSTSTFLIHQPLFPRSASLNGAFHSSLSFSLLHFYLFLKNCMNIILFYSIIFQFLEWMEWWTRGLQGGNWVGEWWFPLLTTKVTQPPIRSGKGSFIPNPFLILLLNFFGVWITNKQLSLSNEPNHWTD